MFTPKLSSFPIGVKACTCLSITAHGNGLLDIPPHVNRTGWPSSGCHVDGDGEPEIGVASHMGYAVFETVIDPNTQQLVLQEKWQFATVDGSSGLTSASAFDFDNDGRSEIVYGDERHLFIFGAADPSGTTGTVLWSTLGRTNSRY